MDKLVKQKFSVDPKFLTQLKSEMDKYNWLHEFISYEDDGKITLFDISHEQTEDAISQALNAFDDEAIKTVNVDILAFQDDTVRRFRVNGSHEIIVDYASDYIWTREK